MDRTFDLAYGALVDSEAKSVTNTTQSGLIEPC